MASTIYKNVCKHGSFPFTHHLKNMSISLGIVFFEGFLSSSFFVECPKDLNFFTYEKRCFKKQKYGFFKSFRLLKQKAKNLFTKLKNK